MKKYFLHAFAAVLVSATTSILLSREGRNHHVCPTATVEFPDKGLDTPSAYREFWRDVYSNLTQDEVTVVVLDGVSVRVSQQVDFLLKSPRGMFDCSSPTSSLSALGTNVKEGRWTTYYKLTCRSYGYATLLGKDVRYLFVHSDTWTIYHSGESNQGQITLNMTFNAVFDRMISTDAACEKFHRAFLQ